MSRKICLLLTFATTLLTNVGCCSMSDRWCGRRNPPAAQCCVPAPAPACYAPPPQAACPPGCYQAPPPPQGYQRPYGS